MLSILFRVEIHSYNKKKGVNNMLLCEYYGEIGACLVMLGIIIGLTYIMGVMLKVAIEGIIESIKEHIEEKRKEEERIRRLFNR